MQAIGPDKEFLDIANTFITAANAHCDTVPGAKVSAAMLYAAARFNAFVVAGSTKSQQELAAQRDAAIAYLVEQYGKMLNEHFGDYQRNYSTYLVEVGEK